MSLFLIFSPILIIVSHIISHRRMMRRRAEINRLEKLLDDNGIHFEPSTMYRRKKGWRNIFKIRMRKKCKIDEISLLENEGSEVEDWGEFY